MYTTPAITAQLAREYTRDRLREADARRLGRAIRSASIDHHDVVPPVVPAPRRWSAWRAWHLVPGRTTTA